MIRQYVLLLAILLTPLVAACGPAAPRPVAQPTASPAAVQPIVVGAILDVARDSGPSGLLRQEAAALAVELVNRRGGVRLPSGERRPLELVVFDDGGQPERAEPAFRRLVSDGVVAIVGPSSSATSGIVRAGAEAAGVPLIALDEAGSGGLTGWRWTFGLAAPPEEALAATIDFFAASGVDRMGWLAPRTMDASTLRRTLTRLVAAANIQIVAEELYAPGEEAFTQRLARLQASEPRVVLAWPRDINEAASITREAPKVAGLVPVFLGPTASHPSTLDLAGDTGGVVRTVTLRLPVADDLWDHDALTPVIRDFRRELQDATGRPPTSEAAGAWDAVRLIVAAMERPTASPGIHLRVAIRDGLEATEEFLGASGTIGFDASRHDGLDRRALVVARSEGRRWRLPP